MNTIQTKVAVQGRELSDAELAGFAGSYGSATPQAHEMLGKSPWGDDCFFLPFSPVHCPNEAGKSSGASPSQSAGKPQ
jgi:hypothetical protein